MKKLGAFLLILSTVLSFVACNKTTQTTPTTGNGNQQNNSSNGEGSNNGEGGNKQPSKNTLDIVQGSVFSEGIALVLLRDKDYLTAIDMDGNEIFSLDEGYYLAPFDEQPIYYGGSVCCGFANGLIYIHDENAKIILCDKNGTIHKAEDFGGTDFCDSSKNTMLTDGLILIFNENEQTMGALNTSFEWLVPLSQKFYQAYNDLNHMKYYNGYLFSIESGNRQYLNLRTGATGTDLSEIETNRSSDLWYLNKNSDVVDARTSQIVMHIDGIDNKSYNTDFGEYFHNGMKLDLYLKHTEQGFQMEYCVVDDSGNYLVTPTRKESKFITNQLAATDASVMFAGDDKLLLSYATEQVTESAYGSKTIFVDTKWEVRDFKGKVLGSFEVPAPESDEENKKWISHVETHVWGSTITVKYSYTTYSVEYEYQTIKTYTQYFNLNFEPIL